MRRCARELQTDEPLLMLLWEKFTGYSQRLQYIVFPSRLYELATDRLPDTYFAPLLHQAHL